VWRVQLGGTLEAVSKRMVDGQLEEQVDQGRGVDHHHGRSAPVVVAELADRLCGPTRGYAPVPVRSSLEHFGDRRSRRDLAHLRADDVHASLRAKAAAAGHVTRHEQQRIRAASDLLAGNPPPPVALPWRANLTPTGFAWVTRWRPFRHGPCLEVMPQ